MSAIVAYVRLCQTTLIISATKFNAELLSGKKVCHANYYPDSTLLEEALL